MKDKVNHIVNWIKDYAEKNNKTSLVVGVSGGIDSSVVSTLCAMTGIKTIPIVMTIKNKDIDKFFANRAKRGRSLPRGYQQVSSIDFEIKASTSSEKDAAK